MLGIYMASVSFKKIAMVSIFEMLFSCCLMLENCLYKGFFTSKVDLKRTLTLFNLDSGLSVIFSNLKPAEISENHGNTDMNIILQSIAIL
jgi:hypothetical protein